MASGWFLPGGSGARGADPALAVRSIEHMAELAARALRPKVAVGFPSTYLSILGCPSRTSRDAAAHPENVRQRRRTNSIALPTPGADDRTSRLLRVPHSAHRGIAGRTDGGSASSSPTRPSKAGYSTTWETLVVLTDHRDRRDDYDQSSNRRRPRGAARHPDQLPLRGIPRSGQRGGRDDPLVTPVKGFHAHSTETPPRKVTSEPATRFTSPTVGQPDEECSRSVRVRRHPPPQQACRLRLRRPLLSRCPLARLELRVSSKSSSGASNTSSSPVSHRRSATVFVRRPKATSHLVSHALISWRTPISSALGRRCRIRRRRCVGCYQSIIGGKRRP